VTVMLRLSQVGGDSRHTHIAYTVTQSSA